MGLTCNLIFGLLISSVAYVIYYRWTRRRFYALAAKIPGPKMLPVIGAAHLFMDYKEIFDNADKLLQTYGTPLKLWVFTVLLVMVSKPNDVKAILTSPHCLEKEERYKMAKVVLGDGLLTASAPLWKQRRKIINPTFSQKIVESFMVIFKKQSEVLVEQLEKEVDQPDFDVHEYLSRCSLDIICETALGVKVEAQIKPSTVLQVSRRLAQMTVERAFKIWLHSDFIFKLTSSGKEYYSLINFMRSYSGKIVQERKREHNEKMQKRDGSAVSDPDEDSTLTTIKRKPFLEHLLCMGTSEDFTETDLRNEVDTFMHAGSDTTTTTAGYVLVALGIHKNIQEKVFQELDEVFESSDQEITLEDLQRLTYLDKVIKETMRLFPVVPFVARTAVQDIELEKYTIPAGTAVCVAMMHTHMDPEFWSDPDRFDPERFSPEEIAKRNPYSYIPFSAGPRNCIGIRFANLSVKTILASVLRHYSVDTKLRRETMKFSVEIVSKIVGGTMITLKKRKVS